MLVFATMLLEFPCCSIDGHRQQPGAKFEAKLSEGDRCLCPKVQNDEAFNIVTSSPPPSPKAIVEVNYQQGVGLAGDWRLSLAVQCPGGQPE